MSDTTGTDLTIIVPLFRRTKNLDRLMGSVEATVPDAQVLFVVSHDDDHVLMELNARMWSRPDQMLVVAWAGGAPGDYSRKINAGYRYSTRPLLFTGADDIVFQPGWYEAARAPLRVPCDAFEPCPDGHPSSIGVVGTVDDLNGRTILGEHSTHTLIARWYADQGACADEPEIIYHEGYHHEYCDDELCQTAMARGAYAHAFDAHVTHIHMLSDPGLDDETYRHGRSATRLSRRRYLSRRRLWGGAPR